MNRWNQSLREGIKRGVPWTPEEDKALRASVREHGEDWLAAAAAVPPRGLPDDPAAVAPPLSRSSSRGGSCMLACSVIAGLRRFRFGR